MWQFFLLLFIVLRGHEFAVSENVVSLDSNTTVDPETAFNSTSSVDTFNSTLATQLSTTPKPRINQTVCYDWVGCFDNYPPFDNANYALPMSPEEVGTQFLLYTRHNPATNETQFMNYTDINNLTNSYFDARKKTKFIIHGFSNSITTEWIYEMKDELLKAIDANVFVVTWGPGAQFPNYARAVANTRIVATQITLLIDRMVQRGVNPENVHLIGHSLGAHISGYTGYLLSNQGFKLGRITGMDPAQPDFENHPAPIRLDENDAIFVDAIHTNGVTGTGAGLMQQVGDVDFYVNGGESQPSCPNPISGALSHIGDLFTGNIKGLPLTSHANVLFYACGGTECGDRCYSDNSPTTAGANNFVFAYAANSCVTEETLWKLFVNSEPPLAGAFKQSYHEVPQYTAVATYHWISDAVACSHGRSHEYFTESINSPCPFTAYPCDSYEKFQRGDCTDCGTRGCSQLGYYSDWYKARGKMYLKTRPSTPFCGYHYSIRIHTAVDAVKTKGKVRVRLNGRWGTSGWMDTTEDDINPGTQIHMLAVSAIEVGDVDSIDVSYVKSSGGFLWGSGGSNTLKTDRVLVLSGENGDSYLFCVRREIQSDTPLKVQRTTTRSC